MGKKKKPKDGIWGSVTVNDWDKKNVWPKPKKKKKKPKKDRL